MPVSCFGGERSLKSSSKACASFFLGFSLLFLVFVQGVGGQAARYTLGQPIIVTASRIPVTLDYLARSVTVIDRTQIRARPVHSIPDLLSYGLGIDVRRRGVYGIQADLSIRGSSFEQVSILVDGTKIYDPQTGHFHLDIPLSLMDIERIEVLRGHGSSLYGPNAFGGVVNIITRKAGREKAQGTLIIGEHDLSVQAISLSGKIAAFGSRLSFERKRSSGYHPNTQSDQYSLFLGSQLQTDTYRVALSFGFADKDFGADSFYSAWFPNQQERTKTTFLRIGLQRGGEIHTKVGVHYRRHWDRFILDKTRPAWYVNRHTNYSYGGGFQVSVPSSIGNLVTGIEVEGERISSTRLGDHIRTRGALYAEFVPGIGDRFYVDLGLRGDYFSEWGWEAVPTISLSRRLGDVFKLRASVGRSFRVPTFTELYYEDPANVGNPGLKPERAWSFEIGADYFKPGMHWDITFFRREGRDIIDWIKEDPEDPWGVENIGRVITHGVETGLGVKTEGARIQLPFTSISLNYGYLNSERREGEVISKYVLDYLRHQIGLEVQGSHPFGVYNSWRLVYRERVGERGHLLLDIRFSKRFGKMQIILDIANLLNTSYSEVGGVPMPGRWISGGLRTEL